jgi:hypothetical protein
MNDMHSILATFAKLDSGHSNVIFVNSNTLAESEDDPAEKGEYDREGDMANDDLDTAKSAVEELQSIIDSDENLPEWVQAKITKAMDYLDTSRDYLKAQQNDAEMDSDDEDHDEESDHIAECFDTAMGQQEQESGMSINTNADSRTGRKTVTVTADGEAANELMAILKMAGLGGGQQEVEEEYSNEPNPQTADAHTQLVTMSSGTQTMKKHGYQQGDNPLAMQEQVQVQKMTARLQSKFKG